MGLLKSTDIEGLDYTEYRDCLYYNKYKYRASVTIRGLRRGYYFDPEEFVERLKNNNLWGKISKDEKDIILLNLPEIKILLKFRKNNRGNKQLTIRTEGNTMSIFTNDLEFLHKSLDKIDHNKVRYTEVETRGYVGVKTFINEPKYKYRVYLKSKRIDDDFRDKFRQFFKINTKLYPSNALIKWLNPSIKIMRGYWFTNWTSANHFIDYNDESYLTYLALIYGDYLGKKFKLIKRPDPV